MGIRNIRLVSVLLAAALCLTLAACGKKAGSNGAANTSSGGIVKTTAATVASETGYGYVGSFQELKLDVENVSFFTVQGDAAYLVGSNYNLDTGMTLQKLFRLDLTSGALTELHAPELADNRSISYITASSDGFWYLIQSYQAEVPGSAENEPAPADAGSNAEGVGDGEVSVFSGSIYTLVHTDLNGAQLGSVEVQQPESAEGFYPSSMAADSKGNLQMIADERLYTVSSADGSVQQTTDLGGSGQSVCVSGDGTVYVSYYSEDGYSAKLGYLDPNGVQTLDASALGRGYVTLFPGSGSTLLCSDGTDLYTLDRTTNTQGTKLLNWVDSDVYASGISGVGAVGEDKILVCNAVINPKDYTSTFELGTLVRTPEAEIPVKTVLTYGTENPDGNVTYSLVSFNRHNEHYRIHLVDYGTYNTEENSSGAADQLQKDLIAGTAPDILNMKLVSSVERYVSKGILTDMYPLLEQDGDLGKDDLSAAALGVCTVKGGLYEMPLAFTATTLYGLTDAVGSQEGWSLEDFYKAVSAKDSTTKVMQETPGPAFLSQMVQCGEGSFLNRDNASCSFDSQAFIDLLKVCATMPASYESASMDGEKDVYVDELTAVREGLALLGMNTFMDLSSVEYIHSVISQEHGFTNVGYPGIGGNGAVLTIPDSVGINAACADQAGAWTFVKYLLSPAYQETLYGFPVRKSAFDAAVQTYLETAKMNGPSTYIVSGNDAQGVQEAVTYEMAPLTEEQIASFRTYLDGATGTMNDDKDLMTIIDDETKAFFAGDKTAEETAKLIQSRVSIYLSEQN